MPRATLKAVEGYPRDPQGLPSTGSRATLGKWRQKGGNNYDFLEKSKTGD